MSGCFVTATGTEVGKTYVTAGLVRACRRARLAVEALKPVMTGYDPADMAGCDAGVLLQALDRDVTPEGVARIAPFRFAAPLAPSMAAPLEGRRLDVSAVAAACRAAVWPDALTFIEGIGGVMVPLDERHTVLDLIGELGLPVLLVSGTQLGALSHCLAAYEVLSARGHAPVRTVLVESDRSAVPLEATREALGAFLGHRSISIVPRNAADETFDTLLAALGPTLGLRPSRGFRSLA